MNEESVDRLILKLKRTIRNHLMFPDRVDPGTKFRSKGSYKWKCPICEKQIEEGDIIIAFAPEPGARTTYVHEGCDE